MSEKAELIGKRFPVLDKGHVELIDVMGDDAAIADAARISYGKGTRSVSDDRTLIRYLMRHHHGTPFEMAEIKIGVKVPMDTWRQWIRHRTANVNEYSTRYSEAIEDMQATPPDAWRLQSGANKQGSSGTVTDWPEGTLIKGDEESGKILHLATRANGLIWDEEVAGHYGPLTPGAYLSYREEMTNDHNRQVYEERLKFGVAREQARKDLPLSTYTEAYWKCDLRNVLGFLSQRMDSHAQLEIRQYATIIGEQIVAPLFPATWEAFKEYTLDSVSLTSRDIEVIRAINSGRDLAHDPLATLFNNGRERQECAQKLVRLGFSKGGI